MNHRENTPPPAIDRRRMLAQSAGLAAIGGLGLNSLALRSENVSQAPVVTKGNIHQSLVYWCFSKYWDVEKTCQIAKQLGIPAIEIVAPEHWPTLKKHGLVCSLASSHGFDKGMNNPKY